MGAVEEGQHQSKAHQIANQPSDKSLANAQSRLHEVPKGEIGLIPDFPSRPVGQPGQIQQLYSRRDYEEGQPQRMFLDKHVNQAVEPGAEKGEEEGNEEVAEQCIEVDDVGHELHWVGSTGEEERFMCGNLPIAVQCRAV